MFSFVFCIVTSLCLFVHPAGPGCSCERVRVVGTWLTCFIERLEMLLCNFFLKVCLMCVFVCVVCFCVRFCACVFVFLYILYVSVRFCVFVLVSSMCSGMWLWVRSFL